MNNTNNILDFSDEQKVKNAYQSAEQLQADMREIRVTHTAGNSSITLSPDNYVHHLIVDGVERDDLRQLFNEAADKAKDELRDAILHGNSSLNQLS